MDAPEYVDPEAPKILSYEYMVIWNSLIGEIDRQISKKMSQVKWCKDENKYLKLHYEQELTSLRTWKDSIEKAKLRAFNKEDYHE